MWTPCPVGLDHTVKILGLELEDIAMVFATPFLLSNWFDTLETYLGGLGVGMVLYLLKRGKPAGTLLHRTHGLELIGLHLPGVLSPYAQTYSAW